MRYACYSTIFALYNCFSINIKIIQNARSTVAGTYEYVCTFAKQWHTNCRHIEKFSSENNVLMINPNNKVCFAYKWIYLSVDKIKKKYFPFFIRHFFWIWLQNQIFAHIWVECVNKENRKHIDDLWHFGVGRHKNSK